MANTAFASHHESSTPLPAPPAAVFAWLDDHRNLAAHMSRSSMMMAGGSMQTSLDEGQGRQPGSHIRMQGRVLGLPLALDEVVTEREPPLRKAWATVGEPTLWVIGGYRMGFVLAPDGAGCVVTIFIDYNPPASPFQKFLSYWMGRPYAVWCVKQMQSAVVEAFAHGSSSSAHA